MTSPLTLLLGQGEDIREPLTFLGPEWGPKGGVRARKAALWAQLQREARQQGILPAKAVQRLDYLGLNWELQVMACCTSKLSCEPA